MKGKGRRAGIQKATSRAKARGRYDRRTPAEPDLAGDLRKWLTANVACSTVQDLERFDLNKYLDRTSTFPIESSERLRQLAIHLEVDAGCWGYRSWLGLERIYETALQLDPDAELVLHSRAVSCDHFLDLVDEPGWQDRIRVSARKTLDAREQVRPRNADIAYLRGLLEYKDASGDIEEALQHFQTSIELDSNHGYARLYIAHCLHDLERWDAAVAAYSEVPLDQLVGACLWRADTLIEQRATCLLRGGKRDEALTEFDRILSRYEREPERARWSARSDLERAARGEFRVELGPRFEELQRVLWDEP